MTAFILTLLVLRVLAFAGDQPRDAGSVLNGEKNSAPSVSSSPYIEGREGYVCYRAPAMVISQKGTVLAFCEGRVNDHNDEGDIDLVLKRSTDGGRTWGPIQVLENDGENRCKNACPVVLPTGRILVVWLWNKAIPSKRDRTTREVYVTCSDDDGVTWSKSRNITASVYREDWRCYGAGPCHGIVKAKEPHKGRVLMPCRHNSRTTDMISHVIYSDDNGETWQIGGSAPREKTNESTIAELSNGDLMLNSRNGDKGRNSCRIVSISTDGGETFPHCYVDNALIEPGNGCFGSLLNHSMNERTGKANILFSNPNDGEERVNGTLKLSEDDGATWVRSVRYSKPAPSFSGYSDIAVINETDVAVLYEKGDNYRATHKEQEKGERYEAVGFLVVPFSAISTPLTPERASTAKDEVLRVSIRKDSTAGGLNVSSPLLPDNTFPFLSCEAVVYGDGQSTPLFEVKLSEEPGVSEPHWIIEDGSYSYVWTYAEGIKVEFSAAPLDGALKLGYTLTNVSGQEFKRVILHTCIPTTEAPLFFPGFTESPVHEPGKTGNYMGFYDRTFLWSQGQAFTVGQTQNGKSEIHLSFTRAGQPPVEWGWWRNGPETFGLPFIAVQSRDGRFTAALGFEAAEWISCNGGDDRACFHLFPLFGDLKPGKSRTVEGRFYLMPGTHEDALAQFTKDMPLAMQK